MLTRPQEELLERYYILEKAKPSKEEMREATLAMKKDEPAPELSHLAKINRDLMTLQYTLVRQGLMTQELNENDEYEFKLTRDAQIFFNEYAQLLEREIFPRRKR